MRQFDLSTDDDRLTLTAPLERRLLAAGCPLFLLASACLLFLGFLSILQETDQQSRSATSASTFFNPHVNHFGFLWVVACIFMAAFVPFYAWMVNRTSTVFVFDRSSGDFLRYGRRVTRLSRVEHLHVRRIRDVDGYSNFEVYVIYGDGRTEFIDDSPDEAEASVLAQRIADFIGVTVLSARAPAPSP